MDTGVGHGGGGGGGGESPHLLQCIELLLSQSQCSMVQAKERHKSLDHVDLNRCDDETDVQKDGILLSADLRVHGELLYLLVLLGGHVAGVPVLLQRQQHLRLGLVAAGQAQHAEAVVSQLGLETRVNFSIYN